MVIFNKLIRFKYLIVLSLVWSFGSCTDFPAFPDIPIQEDMMVADAIVDMKLMEDMQVIQMKDMQVIDMDMEVESPEMDPEMDPEMGIDMEPEIDMEVIEIENFTETLCNSNMVIEGSERRFVDGIEQMTEALPCRVVGERFLRVDPVEDVQLSAELPRNPDIDDGVTSATTDYTYFFMAREVSFKLYESICTTTERPQDAQDRISQATCLSPSSLLSSVPEASAADCSVQKQTIFDSSSSGETAEGEQADLPMNCVDWESAANYCRQIGGRLPSEAEWEIAVTYGRTLFPTPWPDTVENEQICDYANIGYAEGETCQATNPSYTDAEGNEQSFELRPTCWGAANPDQERNPIICDAVGNVAEWTLNDYSADFPEDLSDGSPYVSNPQSLQICLDSMNKKVTKGGAANIGGISAQEPIVSLFGRKDESCDAEIIGPYIGFRCVVSEQSHGVSVLSTK